MKPFSALNLSRDHSDWPARRFPIVDCNYQLPLHVDPNGHCASLPGPSFRNISGKYFRDEARYDFVSEAIFFALIAATVALPLAAPASVLFRFLCAVAHF